MSDDGTTARVTDDTGPATGEPIGGDAPTRARLDRRLAAVERAVTDATDAGDGTAGRAGSGDAASVPPTDEERLAELEDNVEELEGRLAALRAATEAVRGYVGGVRAVNRRVEHRADAALAAVARLDPDATEAEASDGGEGATRAPDDADDTLVADDTLGGVGRPETDDVQPPWWADETPAARAGTETDRAGGKSDQSRTCPRLAERGP